MSHRELARRYATLNIEANQRILDLETRVADLEHDIDANSLANRPEPNTEATSKLAQDLESAHQRHAKLLGLHNAERDEHGQARRKIKDLEARLLLAEQDAADNEPLAQLLASKRSRKACPGGQIEITQAPPNLPVVSPPSVQATLRSELQATSQELARTKSDLRQTMLRLEIAQRGLKNGRQGPCKTPANVEAVNMSTRVQIQEKDARIAFLEKKLVAADHHLTEKCQETKAALDEANKQKLSNRSLKAEVTKAKKKFASQSELHDAIDAKTNEIAQMHEVLQTEKKRRREAEALCEVPEDKRCKTCSSTPVVDLTF